MSQTEALSSPVSHAAATSSSRRPVGLWLMIICVLIALMVIVGGATRLTNSGLSITEWHPITGVVPPLDQAAWQAEFAKYQRIPQYQLVNRGMSLDQFKSIYWWEWGHRLLGRLIGIAFFAPLVWFAVTRRLSARLAGRLVLILVLGGAQGVLGWYMVKSGLADRVEVSQYRLAAHLGLAFILFALTFWTALDVLRPRNRSLSGSRFGWAATVLCGLVFCQVLLGALVAGLRAGYRFNSWPLMEGRFVPNGAGAMRPFWRNFFENQAMVQFDHRIGAYLILAAVIGLAAWGRSRSSAPVRRALDLTLAAVILQASLGIWTLLAVVPLLLGLFHQTGALVLFAASLNLAHAASAPRASALPAQVRASQAAATRSLGSGP